MLIRKITIILLSSWLTQGYAQSKFERLGNSDAVVLDMMVDEANKLIVAATSDDLQLWNYESKKLIRRWPVTGLLAIDRSGGHVAGVLKSGKLLVWDLVSDKEPLLHQVSPSALHCVTWIDSLNVAMGSDDGMIYSVNTLTGQTVNKVTSGASVTAIATSGTNLIAGSSEGDLQMYDAGGLTLRKSFKGHESWIRGIQVNDSTGFFVTVADDGMYKEWDASAMNRYERKFSKDWLTSVDVGESWKFKTIVIGKASGEVSAFTSFAEYSMKFNAIVNKAFLLRDATPLIRIVVATHGSGIQIWDGLNMKLN